MAIEDRFAFTAQFWGNGAVVCRATEDRPGPVVEQQFGEFHTWTQASACAAKLNDGLDLDPLEARQIITSSLLATACILEEALNSSLWEGASAAEVATRAARLEFILGELRLAMTFCRSARHLSEAAVRRVVLHVQRVLLDSARFLETFHGDSEQLESVAAKTEQVKSALQPISACLPACLPACLASLKGAPRDFPDAFSKAPKPPRLLIDYFVSRVDLPPAS